MKKLVILSILFLGYIASAQQIAENAIGLRIGGNNGFEIEISYQKKIAERNRLEFDLGWRDSADYNAFKLTSLYQWIWNIDGGFNWYAGGGGGLGSWNTDIFGANDGFFVFATGNVGIEYDFDFPLLISLDVKPEIGFTNYYNDNIEFDIALGIRYQF